MVNTWPNNIRQALDQSQHERWNSYNYSGTRQLCSLCEEPTGRCEEDSLYLFDTNEPVCETCYCKEV